VKVKTIQVKDKELAARNIRDGKLRQGRNAEGVDKRNEEDRFTRKKRSRSSEDDSGKEYVIRAKAEKSRSQHQATGSGGQDSRLVSQLESEITGLQSKLNQYHEQVTQLEQEMEQKCNKCNEEVELGK
jgi:hypothetical protein